MSASKTIAELNAMLAAVQVNVKTICMFCKHNSDERLMFTADNKTRGICHICSLTMCNALIKYNTYTRQEIYKLVDASRNESTE